MERIANLDYLRTAEGIHIRVGSYGPEGKMLVVPVFTPDVTGDRQCDGTAYRRLRLNDGESVALEKAEYRPDLGVLVHAYDGPISRVWRHDEHRTSGAALELRRRIASVLGLETSLIGSHLLGMAHHRSDIDVLVYGTAAAQRIRSRWQDLLGATGGHEDFEHIRARAKRYTYHAGIPFETLLPLFVRRRSMFRLTDTRLVSLLTAYDSEPAPVHPVDARDAHGIEAQDTILDDTHTTMMPRLYRGATFSVYSFRYVDADLAREGERVRIRGSLLADGHTIILAARDHYILPLESK